VAQLNSALDYGSRGCWFESSRGHKTLINIHFVRVFSISTTFIYTFFTRKGREDLRKVQQDKTTKWLYQFEFSSDTIILF
jgi:hypothetical protein